MSDTPCLASVLAFHPNRDRSMEAFLLRRADALHQRGWRSAFVFSGEPAAGFAAELDRLNAPWRVARFQLSVPEAKSVGEWLRNHDPLAIETSFMSKFDRAVRVLKRSAGARYWVCADHSSGGVNLGGPAKRLLARIRGAWVSRAMDRLVCVSEFVRRRDTEQLFLSVPSRVVHNGIDLSRFAPSAAEPPPKTIAFAGQLIPEKGLHTLIRAVGTIAGVQLRVAGQGTAEKDLRLLADSVAPGRVEFLGQTDGVRDLYCNSSMVVVPSEWDEAFGFVVIEALACGAAVVASDAGALPEVLADAGLTFRRGDPEHLASVLRDLFDHPERVAEYRSRARARAEHFSLDRMVAGYVAVYEELAAERTAGRT